MMRGITSNRIILKGVMAAAVTALAGCGGGGGSDGITDQEAAALSASSLPALVSSAQSTSGGQTDTASTSTLSSAVTTQATGCQNGGQKRVVSGGASKTSLDITTENFPTTKLTNEGSMVAGSSDSEAVQRYDECVVSGGGVTTTTDGAIDSMVRTVSTTPNKEIVASKFAGFQGFTSSPDFANPFTTDTTGDTTFSLGMRGWIYGCVGCVGGDLSDFSSTTPARDQAFALALELNFDDGSSGVNVEIGTPKANRADNDWLTMTASATGTGTDVTFNGPFRVNFPGQPGCSFESTFNTKQALQYTDFTNPDSSKIVGGEVDVTQGDGDTHTVTFDSQGNVYVDGEQVDVQSAETDCEVTVSTSTST